MPVTNWNITTIDGKQFLVVDVAKFRIPLDWDPDSNMFFAVCSPDGGLGNIPALVRGDDGATPVIDTAIDFTALAATDATADYASFTQTSPNVYKLALGVHKGAKGDTGAIILTPSDYGTPISKYILRIKSDLTGFELVAQRVGDSYWPATIANTPSGNSAYTLCSVPVPAQPFDWRPHVEGQCIITGTNTDVSVDLIARLNVEASGNIVGRAFNSPELSATSHVHPTQVLSSGPPAGSADTYNKVLAGNAATIYFRAERQTGGETFTTSNATTRFGVEVRPIL